MRGIALCIGVAFSACTVGEDQPVNDSTGVQEDPPPPVPVTTKSFTEIEGNVLNPERGWYSMFELYPGHAVSFSSMRSAADPVAPTLALLRVDLDQSATTISASWLVEIEATLAKARAKGIKVILRPNFRRNDGETPFDPTDGRVEQAAMDLAPVIQRNLDVIAVAQMGFLGPWGEFWYDGSQPSPLIQSGSWHRVMRKFLDATAPLTVSVRRPAFKSYFLTTASTQDGDTSRLGYFNDCFLGNGIDDQGTFTNHGESGPNQTVAFWRQYHKADSLHTFSGGEACGNNGRATCAAARADLQDFHWSYLGNGWFQGTVGPSGKLSTDPTGSCRLEIGENLGYRFVIEEATYSTSVRPGETLELEVRLRNDGYAPAINRRPVYAVLQGADGTYVAELTGADVDPRDWAAGSTRTFSRKLRVPATAGTYSLGLWLPDPSMSIRDRSEYAIRFANNEDMWSSETGFNTFTTSLSVSESAVPNGTTPDATFVAE